MIKIWHIYNNSKFIINGSNIINFDVNNDNLQNYNINNLNKYLNEYVGFYYVWKNKIKSDIIGFSHNKYVFNNIDIERINNYQIQVYEIYQTTTYNIYEDINYIGLGYFCNNIIDYIKTYYYDHYKDCINILFNPDNDNKLKPIRNTFICKWEIFDNLMIFINGFLELLLNKEIYNLNNNELELIISKFNDLQWNQRIQYFNFMNIKEFKGDFFGYPRNIAYLIEYLVEIYFLTFYKNKYFLYD